MPRKDASRSAFCPPDQLTFRSPGRERVPFAFPRAHAAPHPRGKDDHLTWKTFLCFGNIIALGDGGEGHTHALYDPRSARARRARWARLHRTVSVTGNKPPTLKAERKLSSPRHVPGKETRRAVGASPAGGRSGRVGRKRREDGADAHGMRRAPEASLLADPSVRSVTGACGKGSHPCRGENKIHPGRRR